jgi:hypothetical protein
MMKTYSLEDLIAAEARGYTRGYARAVAALRDRERYEAWVVEDMRRPLRADGAKSGWPYAHHAPRFADYLEETADVR